MEVGGEGAGVVCEMELRRAFGSEGDRWVACAISGLSLGPCLLRLLRLKMIVRPASKRRASTPPTAPPMIAPLLDLVLRSAADVAAGIARVGLLAA